MTNNEKSATFIGWKPYEQDFVHGAIWRDEDGIRAPDMSKPENYMRALVEQIVSLEHDYEGWHCSLARLMPEDSKVPVIPDWHETAGQAVISAFARLYDAENGTNER